MEWTLRDIYFIEFYMFISRRMRALENAHKIRENIVGDRAHTLLTVEFTFSRLQLSNNAINGH